MIGLTNTILATTAGGTDTAARLFWDLLSIAVQVVAVIRTVKLEAQAWTYRRWSKAAAILLATSFCPTLGILRLPVGAICVIWHTGTVARRYRPEPPVPDLPYAEGSSETRQESR